MAVTSTNTSVDGFHSGIAIELPQVTKTASAQDHPTPTRSAGTLSGPALPLDSSSNTAHDASTAPTPSLLEPSRTNDATSETGIAQQYPDVGTIKSLRGALILAITCGSQLMDDMFITSGNMALPSVQTAFTVPTASLQWLVSAYVLTFGGFLLLSGVLADRHGRKRVFCAGMANLTVWTLANGFAGSFVQLAVFRALQGIGAAMTIPSAIGIISNYFVAQERLLALTVFSAMGSLGFCLGLVLGGVLTSSLGWRYVFYLPASITGTLCVLGVMVLPADKREEGEEGGSTRPKLDFVGAVLSTAALILLSFVLSSAGLLGWGKAFMIVLLVLSVAMICGFTWLESKVENPIMPLSLWKLRNFAPTWISAFCKTLLLSADLFWSNANSVAVMFGGYQSTLYYMTLLAQDINHLSAGETSVRLLPMGMISFLVCLLMWWMLEVYDSKYLLLGGMVICTIAPIPSAIMQTGHTNFWEHVFSSAVMTSVGFTILFCTITVALLASVPANIKSLCGGMIQSAFQIGGGVGLAITSAIVQSTETKKGHGLLEQYRTGMWCCVALSGVGLVVTLFGVRTAQPSGLHIAQTH